MNALELLKQDHQKVAGLFEQAEQAGNQKQKRELFDRIKAALETHTQIEESIFYPALEQQEGLRALVAEAYEEHQQVSMLLGEAEKLPGNGKELDASLNELKENVEHHVEEEETQMFPRVREHFSASELEQMGLEMEQMKQTQSRAARSSPSPA